MTTIKKGPYSLHVRRQQGALLLEAVLAVGILAAMIGVVAAVSATEESRQERGLLASEQRTIISASRAFVGQQYADIRDDLFAASQSGSRAIVAYRIEDLVTEGYLPVSFNGNGIMGRLAGQRYALLARAVERDDTSYPKATMSEADLDAGGNGSIATTLVDNDTTNNEMDIEAVLVTYGGDPFRLADGGGIIASMETSFAGFVRIAGEASGPYGNFTIDITPYSTLPEYPGPGNFASLIAMSEFGVFDEDGTNDNFVPDPFRRCDISIGTVSYDDCLANNEIYSEIVLRPYDSDSNGTIDRFPAIRNLTMVDCAEGSAEGVSDEFLIDCSTTKITGNLDVDGPDARIGALQIDADSLDFGGGTVVQRSDVNGTDVNIVSGDRLVMDGVNGGQDLTEAILDTRVVYARGTMDKPICPPTTIDGTPIAPRIYVSPAAYSDPEGRPIIGVRAYAEDLVTQWRVRLIAFVGQDLCTNDPTNPIQFPYSRNSSGPAGAPDLPICSDFNPDGTVLNDRSDSNADVYELAAGQGAVIAQSRCY